MQTHVRRYEPTVLQQREGDVERVVEASIVAECQVQGGIDKSSRAKKPDATR